PLPPRRSSDLILHTGPQSRCEARREAAAPVRHQRGAAGVRRAAVLLVVGLGCRVAGAADRGRVTLVLARRADYRAEDVEREVLAPFQWAHPGLTVEQQPSTFAQ